MSGSDQRRVVVRLGGVDFHQVVSGSITRNLREIAGSFDLVMQDNARIAATRSYACDQPLITLGMEARISIDGELVLLGWVDELRPTWHASERAISVQGRDRTGDMVDCAAAPNGPAEFNGVDLLAIAKQIAAPFGISVSADVDVGAPFTRLAIGVHEDAMPALEKAARQRSVLLVSDGVGGLLLTRGGVQPGPAPINCGPGGNAVAVVSDSGGTLSWKKRFSDYYVKGQSEKAAGKRGSAALMDHDSDPGDVTPPAAGSATAKEQAGVLMTGHAIDPEVTRWRPTVRVTRTQSGMSSTQDQADWALRVDKGESERLAYGVPDFRAGAARALWRPNQVVTVVDPYQGFDKPMLIDAVSYKVAERSYTTELGLVGPSAYDRINEASKRRQRKGKTQSPPGDSSLEPGF